MIFFVYKNFLSFLLKMNHLDLIIKIYYLMLNFVKNIVIKLILIKILNHEKITIINFICSIF